MQVRESSLRDAARVIVWYPLRKLASRLPEAAAFRLFEAMGDLHRLVAPSRVAAIASRLERALGATQAAARAQARIYLRNHYADRLHIFLYPRVVRRGGAPAFISIEGLPRLDRALAGGRGAIIVHPHYAVPQLLPLALGLRGYRCLQIGLPSDEGLSTMGRAAFRHRVALEALLPARILSADAYLRPAFRWLSEGGVVLITGDGAGGRRFLGRHAEVSFCGRRVLFPLGPAKLASRSGAPILPGIVRRLRAGRYGVEIEAPFVSPTGVDAAAAVTQTFASWFEARLGDAPGLWHFWDEFHEGNLIVAQAPGGMP